MKEFIHSMVVYFLQFLGVDQELKTDLRASIDEITNRVLYSSKTNLRSFSLYLRKIIGHEKEPLIQSMQIRYQQIRLEEMQDVNFLKKEISKLLEKNKRETTSTQDGSSSDHTFLSSGRFTFEESMTTT